MKIKRLLTKKLLLPISILVLIGGGGALAFRPTHDSLPVTTIESAHDSPVENASDYKSPSVPEPTATLGASTSTPPAKPSTKPSSTASTASPQLQQREVIQTPSTDNSALIAACQNAKQSYIDSHPVFVTQADIKHQNNLDAISSDWISRGMGFSGGFQAAKEQENVRYQNELAIIESNYQAKLSSYNC